ncbi:MAG: oligoendopeptidase F [Caldithrix sp.]|nr:oligoendopeptidase F [Caldithrix sp.]
MTIKQKSRENIPEKFKWRLEDIFERDSLWEEAFAKLKQNIQSLKSYAGKITLSAKYLLHALQHIHEAENTLGKLFAYAHMRNDEDKRINKYQDMYERVNRLLVEFNEAVSFFEPELLSLNEVRLQKYYTDEPGLKVYSHLFHDIRRKGAHTLSEKEEKLLALSGEVQKSNAEVFATWEAADIIFPEMTDENGEQIPISNATYNRYQQHPDRRLRKDSYLGLYKPFLEHRHMLATNLSGIIKSHVFNASARHYPATLEAALDVNNIPVSIYTTLIDSTRKQLSSLHRYNTLRKQILQPDDEHLHDYDLRAPLFSTSSEEYSWDRAQSLCLKSTEPLGKDYNDNLRSAFNSGWIDVYENKGKRTGAYSSGTYGVHPYVLMNYNNTIGDVFTLAHEMGHAMHTFYTTNNQPFVYGDYPIFLAEVASTANEALLQKYLIDHAEDDQQKGAYLNAYLDKFSQTFYRQIIFAEFEWRAHQLIEEGQALTADRLDQLFGDIYKEYHGPEFKLDRETNALWSRVPHFYYNYYVFQYATSFVASTALVKQILEEGEPAQTRYLNFLKSGSSKYPIETLQEAGVDMRTEKPIIQTIEWMDQLLDEMDALIQ